ncbi:hypothetical protein TU51_15430 [Bacillus cytotoxicus]|uniref:hypothetical protein n=1 Tax=Bacillus cytotoxicus TaxID=580165 RepID=UPI000660C028|nr:hypothetical protein [Bacillus cytotoxicus]AWC33106.1 DUF723 domain-containing protein [Bacillus cytotoxicus]AWC37133.1 DUF723 domain-containing protein [Bacillus cytotoxicus]AWC61397.1 DUF723 domain-containing protein [Bacillus cytotoxicus]KMT49303.1 hypothetical protein TU51_15430 [Bacillus cytotoxicus]
MARSKFTFEEVKALFDSKGYDLLETDYINARTPMRCKCRQHPESIIQITAGNMRKGFGGCRQCKRQQHKYRTRTIEEVRKEFAEIGYTLLETVYKNNRTKMRYTCPYHPNEKPSIAYMHFKRGVGCPSCGREKTLLARRNEFPKCTYNNIEKEEARSKVLRILNNHCFDCPFNELIRMGAVEDKCYKQCPYGMELRKGGAVLAGEDIKAVTEYYEDKFAGEALV